MEFAKSGKVFDEADITSPFVLPQSIRDRLPVNSQFLRLEQSVVKICSVRNDGYVQYGTGVVISDSGLTCTALHVIELDITKRWKENYVEALTFSDSTIEHKKLGYRVLHTCKKSDIAILQLPKKYRYHPANIDSKELTPGTKVCTIGTQGFKRTLTEGFTICPSNDELSINSFNEYCRNGAMKKTGVRQQVAYDIIGGNITSGNIVTTNPIDKGDSGSGLYSDGRLVGIATSFKKRNKLFDQSFYDTTKIDLTKFDNVNKVAIAVPMSRIMKLRKQAC